MIIHGRRADSGRWHSRGGVGLGVGMGAAVESAGGFGVEIGLRVAVGVGVGIGVSVGGGNADGLTTKIRTETAVSPTFVLNSRLYLPGCTLPGSSITNRVLLTGTEKTRIGERSVSLNTTSEIK